MSEDILYIMLMCNFVIRVFISMVHSRDKYWDRANNNLLWAITSLLFLILITVS